MCQKGGLSDVYEEEEGWECNHMPMWCNDYCMVVGVTRWVVCGKIMLCQGKAR